MRSYTVQLNEGPGTQVGVAPVTAVQPAAGGGPASAAETESASAAPTGPTSAAQAEPTVRAAAESSQPAAQAAHRKPPATASQKRGHATPATSQEREHATTAASQKHGHAAVTASAAGGWHVQVGSFGSRDHADRLAHRLKSRGFSASVSQSASRGRTWYRVRVGPERDRTAALAMASKLRAAGVAAVVQPP